jgi:CobQ-like glutamine amidotransferase family enzyme
MIKLATFMPEYFNNNGDQGNIEVLAKQLEWRGIQHRVSTTDFEDSDFLLVGDASRAVMREFEAELAELTDLISDRLKAGKSTLLVGSSHEYFCSKIPELPKLKPLSRASEFREVTSGTLKIFGYRNTEIDLDLFVERAFISTSLFGPVLAKNQNLLDLVLGAMGVSGDLPVELQARLDSILRSIRSQSLGT